MIYEKFMLLRMLTNTFNTFDNRKSNKVRVLERDWLIHTQLRWLSVTNVLVRLSQSVRPLIRQ